MKLREWFRPKSTLDTLVVILVFLQISYCCWEVLNIGYPWRFFLLLPIATYAISIFAVPSYIRGKKWAWAMIFLFSLYSLHQAFVMKLYLHGGIERSFAIVGIVASAVCLWILGSTAKNHSICRKEFAEVLGAIAVAVAVIFVRGNYFPPARDIIIPPPVSRWLSIQIMSQITAWRMLILLWSCYAAIAILSWIYTKRRSGTEARGVVQV